MSEFTPETPMYSQIAAMAAAELRGSHLAPNLRGSVFFTKVAGGTVVFVEVKGLPHYEPAKGDMAPVGPHGFHVHENGSCVLGDPMDPFQDAGGHWNPDDQPHGHHAGDFPVLFSNDGIARMSFFTKRFSPMDVVGKAVIIHENPDDFESQPSGDSGKRIACGVIEDFSH